MSEIYILALIYDYIPLYMVYVRNASRIEKLEWSVAQFTSGGLKSEKKNNYILYILPNRIMIEMVYIFFSCLRILEMVLVKADL